MSFAGPAKSGRSLFFCVAAGVLGSIAAAQWLPVGPKLVGWPWATSILGGLALAIIVGLLRRTAPPAAGN